METTSARFSGSLEAYSTMLVFRHPTLNKTEGSVFREKNILPCCPMRFALNDMFSILFKTYLHTRSVISFGLTKLKEKKKSRVV